MKRSSDIDVLDEDRLPSHQSVRVDLGLAASNNLENWNSLIKHFDITGFVRGAALCDILGLAINLAGKVAESSVAAAANLHCAAAMSDTTFGCNPANQGFAADVTADPLTVIDGSFAVPTGPGLGVEVDEERVRSLLS